MTDQNDNWWNGPGAAPPPPPGTDDGETAERDATSGDEAPAVDAPPPAEATTVLRSSPVTPAAPIPGGAQQPPAPHAPAPPPPGQQYPPQAYAQQPSTAPPGAPPNYGQQPYPPQAYGQPPGQPSFAAQPYGQAPGVTGSESRRRSGGVKAGALLMLGGAILATVGALLPWLSFDGIGFGDPPNGFETYAFFGDDLEPLLWTNPGAYIIGAYALVAILAIIVLAAGKSTWSSVCGIIAALIGGAVSLAAIAAIADLVNTFRDLNFGIGILLVGLAAVVAFVGSLVVAIVR